MLLLFSSFPPSARCSQIFPCCCLPYAGQLFAAKSLTSFSYAVHRTEGHNCCWVNEFYTHLKVIQQYSGKLFSTQKKQPCPECFKILLLTPKPVTFQVIAKLFLFWLQTRGFFCFKLSQTNTKSFFSVRSLFLIFLVLILRQTINNF